MSDSVLVVTAEASSWQRSPTADVRWLKSKNLWIYDGFMHIYKG